MSNKIDISQQVFKILKANDEGNFTVPTKDLYPFQWNWDSAFHMFGWQRMQQENRAWLEQETLLNSQWDSGMVPHIIFHGDATSYSPGPQYWRTSLTPPTSSISQPPILAYIMKIIYDLSNDKEGATTWLVKLFPKVVKWHQWWINCRLYEELGLVASFHPLGIRFRQ